MYRIAIRLAPVRCTNRIRIYTPYGREEQSLQRRTVHTRGDPSEELVQRSAPAYRGELSAPRSPHELRQSREQAPRSWVDYGTYTESQRQRRWDIQAGRITSAGYLRKCIASNQVSVNDIRVCLHAELSNLDRAHRLQASSPGLAHIVLDYLWTVNPKLWVELLLQDGKVLVALCRVAILEGLEHFLTKWLLVEPQVAPSETLPHFDVLWRNKLWREIVDAHLWINRADRSADAAIRAYFAILDLLLPALRARKDDSNARSSTGSNLNRVSDWATLSMLNMQLGKGEYGNTDARLYDKFIGRYQFRSKIKHTAFGDSWRMTTPYGVACLMLRHPKSPAYRNFINVLRDVDTLENGRKLLPAPDADLLEMSKQAAILARNEGQEQDACYIEKVVGRLLGQPGA